MLFAQYKMAIYYNQKQKDVNFNIGKNAYIRLTTDIDIGYKLPNSSSFSLKLMKKKMSPFTILNASMNLHTN